jgi:dTDP-4-dehydrorhamnose reductase
MANTIVIFGGGGFVGGHLAAQAMEAGWEVHIADAAQQAGVERAEWHLLDIRQAEEVRRLLRAVAPTAVVNLAAVADIDRAEREKELARAINIEAARTIAEAAAAAGSTCLYMSSDAVFDGTAERYGEEDDVRPVNYYGRTKVEGERAVRRAHPSAAVVRISLVLGFPVTAGNSFFAGLEEKLRRGAEVAAPSDEIRTPVDAVTLARCLLEMIDIRFSGLLHIGATDSIDRAALTRRAAALLGYPDARVLVRNQDQPGRAPRHKRGVIDVSKARRLLSTPLLTCDEFIRRAIETRPEKGETPHGR